MEQQEHVLQHDVLCACIFQNVDIRHPRQVTDWLVSRARSMQAAHGSSQVASQCTSTTRIFQHDGPTMSISTDMHDWDNLFDSDRTVRHMVVIIQTMLHHSVS